MATQEAVSAPPADVAPSGQTSTTTNFGESEYGDRLDYSQPKYQDLCCFITFVVQAIAIVAVLFAGWSEVEADGDSSSEGNGDGGVLIVLCLVTLVVSIAFASLWILLLQRYAEQIIKILLFSIIALLAITGIAILAGGETGGAVGPLMACGFTILYTWCVWSRIPFSGALLRIATRVVEMYKGVVYTSFLTVIMLLVWVVIWIFSFIGWIILLVLNKAQFNVVFLFLFVLSLYWGCNVCTDISHATTCGVFASWYFTGGELDSPVKNSFKRTMTTSFGSVCFGALLVSIVQTLRAFFKSNPCCRCLLCLLEYFVKRFNKFALAQCAIYGVNYMTAAQSTWDLLVKAGMTGVIAHDLTGIALAAGALFGGLVAMLLAWATASGMDAEEYMVGASFGIGLYFGYFMVTIVLKTVSSGVVCLFVCYSEDAAAMAQNRPEEYKMLNDAGAQIKTWTDVKVNTAPAVAAGRAPAPTTGVAVGTGVQTVVVQQPVQTVVVQQPAQTVVVQQPAQPVQTVVVQQPAN